MSNARLDCNLIIIFGSAVISGVLLVLSTVICGFLLRRLVQLLRQQSDSNTKTKKRSRNKNQHNHYFLVTAAISATCNSCCCASVFVYTVWLCIEPYETHAVRRYILMRALPTSFWFVSKASLICMYNGRLYFTFQRGRAQSSYTRFICITILIIVSPFLFTTCGYLGVWWGTQWIISLGFEGLRLLYILLTIYLLVMFSRKLLAINDYEHKHMYDPVPTPTPQLHADTDSPSDDNEADHITGTSGTNKADDANRQEEQVHTVSYASHDQAVAARDRSEPEQEELVCFLSITAKFAVLVLIITVFQCLVAVCWTLYTWVLQWSSVTLLLPLLMFSIDSVVDSVCIYLFFGFAKTLYGKYCHVADVCFKRIAFGVKSLSAPGVSKSSI